MALSRRRALVLAAGGLTAAPALAKASAGTFEPDPIYAAIERHRVADARHAAACEEIDEDQATADEAGDHCHAALWALAMTVPSTAAGLAAMMAYEREYERKHEDYDLFSRDDCLGDAVAAFHFSIEKAVCQLAGLPEPAAPVRLEWEGAA